jgi:DNA-binding LytR/AlgR family response regulator
MRIRIACCDDEPQCLEQFKAIITDWSASLSDTVEVVFFSDGQALLRGWNALGPFHIVLLDIMMPGVNGYDIARRIRDLDDEVLLVFLTGIKEYVFRGYEVSAFRYLLKPIAGSKLADVLDRALERLRETGGDRLMIRCGNELTCLSPEDLLYVECIKHYARIVTMGLESKCRSRMSDMEHALAGPTIIRCHRAYLINLLHAVRINDEDILMRDGKVIPMARSKRKEVRERFLQIYRKRYLQ